MQVVVGLSHIRLVKVAFSVRDSHRDELLPFRKKPNYFPASVVRWNCYDVCIVLVTVTGNKS